MKKILIRAVIVLGVVLVVAAVAITLSLDAAVKKGIETVGPMVTHVDVKLENAKVSLLSGSGSLHGFLLGNPEGYSSPSAMQFSSASLALKPMSLLSDKIVVRHIRLDSPVITLEGSLRGNNLNDLLKNMKPEASDSSDQSDTEEEEEAASRKLQVDEFTLTGAKVNVNLKELGGETRTLTLPDIHLTDLGTGPEGITAKELTSVLLVEVVKGTLDAVIRSGSDLGNIGGSALQLDLSGDTNSANTARGVLNLLKKKE